jgi:hypothetical protein
LNRLDHGAFTNLVAQAGGPEIFDDRLFSGFPLYFVDGESLSFAAKSISV